MIIVAPRRSEECTATVANQGAEGGTLVASHSAGVGMRVGQIQRVLSDIDLATKTNKQTVNMFFLVFTVRFNTDHYTFSKNQ